MIEEGKVITSESKNNGDTAPVFKPFMRGDGEERLYDFIWILLLMMVLMLISISINHVRSCYKHDRKEVVKLLEKQ
jgi:hypothetical protein